jgi:hypothetical protein
MKRRLAEPRPHPGRRHRAPAGELDGGAGPIVMLVTLPDPTRWANIPSRAQISLHRDSIKVA